MARTKASEVSASRRSSSIRGPTATATAAAGPQTSNNRLTSKSARKSTAAAPPRESSASNDDGTSRVRADARPPRLAAVADEEPEDDNGDDDDDDVLDNSDSDTPVPPSPASTRRSTTAAATATAIASKRTGGKSTKSLAKSQRILKTLKSVQTQRKRRRGFITAETDSGENNFDEPEDEDEDLETVDEEDEDEEDDDGTPRTRSLSITGYQWKAQDVTIDANMVVKNLAYKRGRKFIMSVERETEEEKRKRAKNKKRGASSTTSDSGITDYEDPQRKIKEVPYKRGQLVYFLPDPAWLPDPEKRNNTITAKELDADDWWLGVVLDCVQLKYKDGETACALRVAWCYSPDQAKELFAGDPTSTYSRLLKEHQFWDNELIASDHVDFVSAESTGGPYEGGDDQNAAEEALEMKNAEEYDAALKAYNKLPRRKKPVKFIQPKPKTLPPEEKGKVCIRLMMRGLEESDVQRCTLPGDKKITYKPRKYIERVESGHTLTQFTRAWSAMLSHSGRRLFHGIDGQTIRATIALQDETTKKKLNGKALAEAKVRMKAGGKGKGVGRGKTVPVSYPHGSSGGGSKRKGGQSGGKMSSKRLRQ